MEDDWLLSLWILSNVRKNVGRARVQTHSLRIDNPHYYRLSYLGSAYNIWEACISNMSTVYIFIRLCRWTGRSGSIMFIKANLYLFSCTGLYHTWLYFQHICDLLFIPFPHKVTFWCLCSRRPLKTLWQKENLLIMSNFSFYHNVFNTIQLLHFNLPKFFIFLPKCSQSHLLQNCYMWERDIYWFTFSLQRASRSMTSFNCEL